MGLTPPSPAPPPAAPLPHRPDPLVTGSGQPVTVAAHGLGGSVAETRPLLSGVTGRRVFPRARGHDGAPAGPVSYALLGADLLAVADRYGAQQALGVSMGAGALLALLAAHPQRLDRAVLLLPAAIDRPRADPAVRRLAALDAALQARDPQSLDAAVAAELPADLADAPAARAYRRARVAFLLASPGVGEVLRALPRHSPVADRSRLGAVSTEVLVVGQEGDDLHPAAVARELAACLPRAELAVFDRPAAVLRERPRLRALVSGFLNR